MTTVVLTGLALEMRRRAIAANAIREDRRANGVDTLPLTDHEIGIQEMIVSLLTRLVATNSPPEDNRIVPAHQPSTPQDLLDVGQIFSDTTGEFLR